MKRMLSLLVVLAMVLSMVPNVFATSEFNDNDPNGNVDFDELLGKYDRVAEIDQIAVKLEEGSEGQTYVWTPSEDGTVSIALYEDDIPEGAEIDFVVTQGDNFAIYSESEDSSATIEVVAGKDISIEVFEANAAAAEFTLYGSFTAVPGTESNPIVLWEQENTVTNVGTTWYQCYFGGTTMTVLGEGEFSVIYNGETIAAVGGIVSTDVEGAGPRMPVSFAIVGDGEFAVNFTYPAGTQMNPEAIFRPNYIAVNIAAGNDQGYYYKWTSNADGELKLTCPTVEGVEYDVVMTNMTTYESAWLVDSTDGTITLAVSAGDEVLIQVVAVPDASYNYPALETALTGEFIYPVGTQMNPEVLFRPNYIAVNIAEGNNQGYYYKWTAMEAGELKLTCPAVEGVEYDVNMTNMTTYAQAWLVDSTDGTISLAVSAGDEIIIQVAAIPDANWNVPALETALYGEFVYPAGTQMNPEVVTSLEEITAAIAEGNNQGYFFSYTADKAGTLTLQVIAATEGVEYDFNMTNMTTYAQAWLVDSTDGTISLEVAEGDQIIIQVAALPDASWNVPAANITLSGAVESNAPIVITSQPADMSVETYEEDVFTVVAEGNGLTYQWQYSSDSGASWKNTTMTGYNTNALTVKAIASRNGYLYRCLITDADGNQLASDGAVLTVTPSTKVGEITANPVDVENVAGYDAVFTVEGENIESYRWQFRRNEDAPWVNTTLPGYATNELTVWSIVARSGYQYRCRMVALNGAILVSEPATLTVNPSIYINVNPTRQIAAINETGYFSVEAEGVAMGDDAVNLSYQWIYRTGPEDTMWKNTSLTGYNTPNLEVPALLARNGYQYRCAITDAHGIKVYSNVATLSVIGFTTNPKDQVAASGTDAVFSVVAAGADLTYRWQYSKDGGASWLSTSLTGYTTDTLTVGALDSRNGYLYRCGITDANGVKAYSQPAKLTVTAPVVIKSQPASLTAAADDTVYFTVVATGDIVSYRWQYRRNADSAWGSTTMTGYNTNQLEVAAKGRNGYEYRCVITDAAGNVTYTDVAVLTVE